MFFLRTTISRLSHQKLKCENMKQCPLEMLPQKKRQRHEIKRDVVFYTRHGLVQVFCSQLPKPLLLSVLSTHGGADGLIESWAFQTVSTHQSEPSATQPSQTVQHPSMNLCRRKGLRGCPFITSGSFHDFLTPPSLLVRFFV